MLKLGFIFFATSFAAQSAPRACNPESESCALKCEPSPAQDECHWVPGRMECIGDECHWVYFSEAEAAAQSAASTNATPADHGTMSGNVNGSGTDPMAPKPASEQPVPPPELMAQLNGQAAHTRAATRVSSSGSWQAAAISMLGIADGMISDDSQEAKRKLEQGLRGLDAARELWQVSHKGEAVRLMPSEESLNSAAAKIVLSRWRAKFGRSPAEFFAQLSKGNANAFRSQIPEEVFTSAALLSTRDEPAANSGGRRPASVVGKKFGLREELRNAMASESTNYVSGDRELASTSVTRRLEGLHADAAEFFSSREDDDDMLEVSLFDLVRRKHAELRVRLPYLRR